MFGYIWVSLSLCLDTFLSVCLYVWINFLSQRFYVFTIGYNFVSMCLYLDQFFVYVYISLCFDKTFVSVLLPEDSLLYLTLFLRRFKTFRKWRSIIKRIGASFFEESYVFLLQGQADEEEEPLDTEEEGSTILRKFLPNVTRSHPGLTTFCR